MSLLTAPSAVLLSATGSWHHILSGDGHPEEQHFLRKLCIFHPLQPASRSWRPTATLPAELPAPGRPAEEAADSAARLPFPFPLFPVPFPFRAAAQPQPRRRDRSARSPAGAEPRRAPPGPWRSARAGRWARRGRCCRCSARCSAPLPTPALAG